MYSRTSNKNKLLAIFVPGLILFCYLHLQLCFCSSLIIVASFIFILADCDMVLFFYDYFGRSFNELDGKVLWITGASTGIGEGIALELSTTKTKLVLSARSEDKLNNVKAKCIENGILTKEDILILPFDMTDYSKHDWAFFEVLKKFNKLDVLVSNAGRSQRAKWETIDIDVDEAMFSLNTFSLINLARIVTRHFLNVGGGKHVVMSSVAGKVGAPLSASYTASKHAIQGYFEALRAEKGTKGIHVNILCPGPVHSNLIEGLLADKMDKKVPLYSRAKLMPTERCAHLSVVAIVNNVSESWICHQPILLLMYLMQYQPAVVRWFVNTVDFVSIAEKLRDGPKNNKNE